MPTYNEDDLHYWVTKYKRTHDEKTFENILETLAPEINLLPTRFYIKGSDDEDVKAEARYALLKAIEDYADDKGMSAKNFLMMCLRRHVITKIMHAGRKKFKLHNDALSLEDPFITSEEESGQTLADFVPDPCLPLDEKFLLEEELKINYESLLSRLTPLERDVAEEYRNDSSYKEIAAQKKMKLKRVDNAIMRIKKKGLETFSDYEKSAEVINWSPDEKNDTEFI